MLTKCLNYEGYLGLVLFKVAELADWGLVNLNRVDLLCLQILLVGLGRPPSIFMYSSYK